MRDRIEFVIMTTCAFKGQTEKCGRVGLNTVCDILYAILFFDTSTFALLLMETIEGCRKYLIFRRLGEQITRELFDNELIKRFILIKALDDPITPRPHHALAIHLESVAVGVPSDVEPVDRHTFTVSWHRHQPIDILLPGIRRCIIDVRSQEFIVRWQPRDIKRGTAS